MILDNMESKKVMPAIVAILLVILVVLSAVSFVQLQDTRNRVSELEKNSMSVDNMSPTVTWGDAQYDSSNNYYYQTYNIYLDLKHDGILVLKVYDPLTDSYSYNQTSVTHDSHYLVGSSTVRAATMADLEKLTSDLNDRFNNDCSFKLMY